jgi:hypothetical protein
MIPIHGYHGKKTQWRAFLANLMPMETSNYVFRKTRCCRLFTPGKALSRYTKKAQTGIYELDE